ncbi:MAG: hypothetical protein ACO1SV_01275 [Fimbriimonas sp.]
MVLARARNRPPIPEPDPLRDPFAHLLADPTPSGVHEILGMFVLRESSWRLFERTFQLGSGVAVAAAAIYLGMPLDEGSLLVEICGALVICAAPFVGLALWLRLKRDQLTHYRRAYANGVADALTDLLLRLEESPRIDRRLLTEAERAARPYPHLTKAVARLIVD